MRKKKQWGLKDGEKKGRGRRESERKVTCWNRKERKRSSFSAVHVGSVLHKDFFVVVLLDKGLLPWERRQWHHLNWLSLCPSETKALSHPGGVRPGRGGGARCVCVFVCDVWRGPFHVCVHLWELNWAFYAVQPWRNIANIAVKGELDAARVMQIIHSKDLSHEDRHVYPLCAVSFQQQPEQIRGYKAPGWSFTFDGKTKTSVWQWRRWKKNKETLAEWT